MLLKTFLLENVLYENVTKSFINIQSFQFTLQVFEHFTEVFTRYSKHRGHVSITITAHI